MRPGRGGCGARVTCAAGAALLGLAAVCVAIAWANILDLVISHSMRLSPDAEGYSEWAAPSLPIYFDVYLFNWTNAERLVEGEAPHVVQLGPYRYREERRKVNITWHAHNGSVSYYTSRVWTFQPHLSNGSMDDLVTSIDAIAASSAYRSRYWDGWTKMALSGSLAATGHTQLWVRRTAGELLFDGYKDKLLDLSALAPASLGDVPKFDRFGWFYKRNGSLANEGHMTASVGGAGGLAGQVLQWNYQDTARYLQPPCNKVEGSLGEMYPRAGASGGFPEVMTLFSPDLCRPIPLQRNGTSELHGLPLARYAVGSRALDNGTEFPENTCWCGGGCLPSGVFNVSACRHGAPAFVSLPHFLHADPMYRRQVQGLAPDPEKHAFYIDVEPTTGVPLVVAARFQINILISPYPDLSPFRSAPRLLFPVLWVEQHVTVEGSQAARLGGARAAAAWGAPLAAALALVGLAAAVLIAFPLLRRTPASAPPTAELTTLVSTPT